jgi:hypothetical protein
MGSFFSSWSVIMSMRPFVSLIWTSFCMFAISVFLLLVYLVYLCCTSVRCVFLETYLVRFTKTQFGDITLRAYPEHTLCLRKRIKRGIGNISGLETSRNQLYSMRGLTCTTHAQKTIKTPYPINTCHTHLNNQFFWGSRQNKNQFCDFALCPIPSGR